MEDEVEKLGSRVPIEGKAWFGSWKHAFDVFRCDVCLDVAQFEDFSGDVRGLGLLDFYNVIEGMGNGVQSVPYFRDC